MGIKGSKGRFAESDCWRVLCTFCICSFPLLCDRLLCFPILQCRIRGHASFFSYAFGGEMRLGCRKFFEINDEYDFYSFYIHSILVCWIVSPSYTVVLEVMLPFFPVLGAYRTMVSYDTYSQLQVIG